MSTEEGVAKLNSRAQWIWIAAVLLYGIGDTATTFWGLSTGGVSEAGPIASPLIEAYGRFALVGIKAAVFSAFYAGWWLLRTPGRIAVPFALAFVGAVVTVWNLLVITGVL